jgi:zinc transport system substrate-binding protein
MFEVGGGRGLVGGSGALLLVSALAAAPVAAAHRMTVAASIAPLAEFARRVGGERVDVHVLVPPAASPHTYELQPSQVIEVSHARLLVLNDVGLEFWAAKLVRSAANPELEVVDTSKGISLIDEGRAGANPHIWLDVRQAMVQVGHVRDALVRADAAGAGVYRANAESFLAELQKLDEEIAARVAGWSQKEFVSFHPAWAYFARRYGLEQAAVIEKSPGREPSPAELAGIIETVKRIGARAIFAEPQFSTRAAEAVASETGARVVLLDPLGSTVKDGGYVAMMRYNVNQMAGVLR